MQVEVGRVRGIDLLQGGATSLESFAQPTMRLFSGQLVVVVQAGNKPGKLTLKVTDPERGLSSKITIPVL